MKKLLVLGSGALPSIAAAQPASAQSASHILRGAGIGAAGGVVAGATIPGLGVGERALVGAAGGALYNTLINKYKNRTDRSGRSYSPRSGTRASSSAPRYRSYRAN